MYEFTAVLVIADRSNAFWLMFLINCYDSDAAQCRAIDSWMHPRGLREAPFPWVPERPLESPFSPLPSPRRLIVVFGGRPQYNCGAP